MSELEAGRVDMKLEVVMIGVSDVDRAKAFYESLGWRLDADFTIGDFRAMQLVPHNSDAAIIFGKGVTTTKPGSTDGLVLAVGDIEAARAELVARGIDVSEVYHYAGGPFNISMENPRVPGRDPERRSYFSFVSFDDPDGNKWLVQEITSRLPGREWETALGTDVEDLAELLRETEQHHGAFETSHAAHRWSDWYAPYMRARKGGSDPDAAAAAATKHMEEVHQVLPK